MSVLVACQDFQAADEGVVAIPVASLTRAEAYSAALGHWGLRDLDRWVALVEWRGRSWDDWVNEAAWDAEVRNELVAALGWLADHSQGIAIWYAGFPDDVPVALNTGEFRRLVDQQLAEHDLEPAARLTGAMSDHQGRLPDFP